MERVRVHFEAIATGGEAVGRDENGLVVFAPRAAPGDVAIVDIGARHKHYARGSIVELETASAARVTPPCPFFRGDLALGHTAMIDVSTAGIAMANAVSPSSGAVDQMSWIKTARTGNVCGGCQLQHLAYAAQLDAKRGIVREALHRIGGVGEAADSIVQPCVASPLPFNYRNKADLVVAFEGGETQIGFFAPESHHTIDITYCLIQQEPNNELLAAARAAVAAGLAAPFDAATGKGVLRRLVARTSSAGETLLTAVTTRAPWPQDRAFAAHMRAALPSLAGVLRRGPHHTAHVLDGRDWLEENVAGLRLRVTGEGFFQVNTTLTPALLETAMRLAAVEPGAHALDLFCGVGLFALSMARAGAHVVGIEENRTAVRDAKGNAARNHLRADFIAGDASRVLHHLPEHPESRSKASGNRVDWNVVLLDPPRAGAAACIPSLARLRPRRIVYVSCDPATLARDIKALTACGYHLEEAVPIDLFPQTAHVETVARLERTDTVS